MKEEIKILWEDSEALVIYKPAGMVVNKVESNKNYSIEEWIGENFRFREKSYLETGENLEVFLKRGGIAHRLDKETSGCLLIAKNPTSLASLMKQFKGRVIKKEYLALVHGVVEPYEGVIRLPISRSKKSRLRQEVRFDGKTAETSWKVERVFNDLSLVRLFPLTGRMHQIRVHMAHLGHPLFSDAKYLNHKLFMDDRERLNHHFLHAQTLEFTSSAGERVRVTSELPQEEKTLLGMLE